MLLVWAFAMVSGMVNACVLDAHGSHPHDPNAHKSEIHEFPAALLDSHSEGKLSHDDEPDVANRKAQRETRGFLIYAHSDRADAIRVHRARTR